MRRHSYIWLCFLLILSTILCSAQDRNSVDVAPAIVDSTSSNDTVEEGLDDDAANRSIPLVVDPTPKSELVDQSNKSWYEQFWDALPIALATALLCTVIIGIFSRWYKSLAKLYKSKRTEPEHRKTPMLSKTFQSLLPLVAWVIPGPIDDVLIRIVFAAFAGLSWAISDRRTEKLMNLSSVSEHQGGREDQSTPAKKQLRTDDELAGEASGCSKYAGLVTVIAVLMMVQYTETPYDWWDIIIGVGGLVLAWKYVQQIVCCDLFELALISALASLCLVTFLLAYVEFLNPPSPPLQVRLDCLFGLKDVALFLILAVVINMFLVIRYGIIKKKGE